MIASLIHVFKYEYAEEIQKVFARLIQEFTSSGCFPSFLRNFHSIVPIPLHPRRFALRGFNQSQHIANSLGEILMLPVISSLRRVRYTAPQVQLNKEERITNIQGAFAIRQEPPKGGIILVDDVYTTGATLQEAARMLLAAGVTDVWGFTLARD